MMSCKNMWHDFIYFVILDLLLFVSKQVTKVFSYSFNLTRFKDEVNFDSTILRVKHINVFTENVIIFVVDRDISILAI